MHHPDPYLYTGLERCFEPSTAQMSDLMRSYHLLRKGSIANNLNEHNQQQWNTVLQRQSQGQFAVTKFDYRTVSEKIMEQLDAAYESWKLTGRVSFNEPTPV